MVLACSSKFFRTVPMLSVGHGGRMHMHLCNQAEKQLHASPYIISPPLALSLFLSYAVITITPGEHFSLSLHPPSPPIPVCLRPFFPFR